MNLKLNLVLVILAVLLASGGPAEGKRHEPRDCPFYLRSEHRIVWIACDTIGWWGNKPPHH